MTPELRTFIAAFNAELTLVERETSIIEVGLAVALVRKALVATVERDSWIGRPLTVVSRTVIGPGK